MVAAAGGRADDGPAIIGVLRLPEVFGEYPCERYAPRPVLLFRAPGTGAPSARIELATPWRFPAESGCEGRKVVVASADRRSAWAELPSVEFGPEQSGAIVVERRGSWYRIALPQQATGWVQVAGSRRFVAIGALPTPGSGCNGAEAAPSAAPAPPPRLQQDGRPSYWYPVRGC